MGWCSDANAVTDDPREVVVPWLLLFNPTSPLSGGEAREGVAQVVVTVKLDDPAGASLHAFCTLPLL
jgi:hypothetical protein